MIHTALRWQGGRVRLGRAESIPCHCRGRGKFPCDSIIGGCRSALGKLAFKA